MTNIRYQKRKANVLVITTVNSNRFSNLVKKSSHFGKFSVYFKIQTLYLWKLFMVFLKSKSLK